MYVLGIDGGGTKTIGVIVSSNGEVKGMATVGSTNMNSVGLNVVESEIKKLISELKKHNLEAFNQISIIFAGMSGAGNAENKRKLELILERIIGKDTSFFVDHDAITALYTGTYGKEGMVHISGTGSIAYGMNRAGKRERVGGWGYLLGDHGSGFAVGQEAFMSLFDRYDQGQNQTILDTFILQHFSVKEPPEMVPIIYGESDSRRLIASIVPFIFKAADEGDRNAQNILSHHATAIAENIYCLTQKLFSEAETQIPVVLTGGLFSREDWLVPTIKAYLESKNMKANLIIPTLPPVIGSVIGGYKMHEIEINQDIIQRLEIFFINGSS